MIAKFPRMSSREIVQLLHGEGFVDVRQRGSHLVLRYPESGRQTVVPVGKKNLPIGTARSIFRDAGIEWNG